MKKPILLLVAYLLSFSPLHAQKQGQALIDSMLLRLPEAKADTNKIRLLGKLSHTYFSINPDSGIYYAGQALALAHDLHDETGLGLVYNALAANHYMKSDYPKALKYFDQAAWFFNKYGDRAGVAAAIGNMAVIYQNQSNYPKSLEYHFRALQMNEELGIENKIAANYQNIGIVYYEQGDFEKALKFYRMSVDKFLKLNHNSGVAGNYTNMGNAYAALKNYDKAIEYDQQALSHYRQAGDKARIASCLGNIGNRYFAKGDILKALEYNFNALKLNREIGSRNGEAINLGNVSQLLLSLAREPAGSIIPDSLGSHQKLLDKALQYALATKFIADEIGDLSMQYNNAKVLSEIHSEAGRYREALDFYKVSVELRDSIFSSENKHKIQDLEQQRTSDLQEKEIEIQRLQLQKARNERWYYLIGFILLIMLLLVVFNRFRVKKRINKQLEKAYNDLKSTQLQLVEQEKLASLGALTAGIAHEIKNPLNFVNNFSELSAEQLDELVESKSMEEKNEIATLIKQNLVKIAAHGKRADSIVHNMLQHSRQGHIDKEPTDINNLCNEIADLAYHGMRANVPDFNVNIQKNFDPALPPVKTISQDLSRVLVNLLNNSFYALNEKTIKLKNRPSGGPAWKPAVTLTTSMAGSTVCISILDNGPGIPENIRKKIFEPFFTTKPTGQGTGLGLSICYDIIKSHGGELTLSTRENEFTEFKIYLPV